jgi:urease alpha subunit
MEEHQALGLEDVQQDIFLTAIISGKKKAMGRGTHIYLRTQLKRYAN